MRAFGVLLTLASGVAWATGPSVLVNAAHESNTVGRVVSLLGGTSPVDQTCPTGGNGWNGVSCTGNGAVPVDVFPTYGSAAPGTVIDGNTVGFYIDSTATPADHRPYVVYSMSFSNIPTDGNDQLWYDSFPGVTLSGAYCPSMAVPSTAYPPIVTYSVQLDNTGECSFGYALEFSMPAGYLGADASTSGATAVMGGILAVMAENHPTWTPGDIKGALRQTASNWAGGWVICAVCGGPSASSGLGFGDVNYAAATALAGTSSIYLQGPGMVIVPHGFYAMVTLYSVITTRRVKEQVFIGGTWPAASAVNEMTAAQVTAAGGTLVYDSAGAAGPLTFSYAPAASGSAVFTAITLDAAGNASRVESFSQLPATFVVGMACLN